MPPDWLESDHRLLVEATRAAGALALRHFGDADMKTWEKEPGHPVSEADIAVDDLLRDRLRTARPDYGWLSEESADDGERLRTEKQWIVDPIDGTRAFLKGRREFCVATALVRDGRPISAVVFNPATDEFFEATKEGGAWLDGRRIKVTAAHGVADATVLTSRTEAGQAKWSRNIDAARITPLSSMAYKLALVAAGRSDAVITTWPKHDWDVVSGDLLIAEAGGCTTSADGTTLTYNGPEPRHPSIVGAGLGLHGALVAHLAKHA